MPTNLNQSQVNKLFGEGEATIILAHCPESQKCFSKKKVHLCSIPHRNKDR